MFKLRTIDTFFNTKDVDNLQTKNTLDSTGETSIFKEHHKNSKLLFFLFIDNLVVYMNRKLMKSLLHIY